MLIAIEPHAQFGVVHERCRRLGIAAHQVADEVGAATLAGQRAGASPHARGRVMMRPLGGRPRLHQLRRRSVAGQPLPAGVDCAHGRQRRAAGRPSFAGGWAGPGRGYLIPAATTRFRAVGVLSTTQLGRPSWRDRRGSAFRLGEMLLLLIGGPGAGVDLRRWAARVWPTCPPGFCSRTASFTGEFIFAAFVWLFAWSFATTVTSDFLELAIQPDEVAARESHEWGDSRSQWRAAKPLGRTELLQRFATALDRVGHPAGGLCGDHPRSTYRWANTVSSTSRWAAWECDREVVACLVCYFSVGPAADEPGAAGRAARAVVQPGSGDAPVAHPALAREQPGVRRPDRTASRCCCRWVDELADGHRRWSSSALLARVMMGIGFVLGLIIAFLASLAQPAVRIAATAAKPISRPRYTAGYPHASPRWHVSLPPWVGNAVLWLVVALVAGFLLVNFLRTTGLMESKLGKRLIDVAAVVAGAAGAHRRCSGRSGDRNAAAAAPSAAGASRGRRNRPAGHRARCCPATRCGATTCGR